MAQKSATIKAKPMDKDEVMLLLSLVENHSVINSKATNATNNRLKEEAWKSITVAFRAHTGEHRTPEQLRLKWDNLKKAARKRSANIRQNNLKTGGGKSFIGPDEVLDHVTTMLGATCNGYTVEFGGDSEYPGPNSIDEAMVALPDEVPVLIVSDATECGDVNAGGLAITETSTKEQQPSYTSKNVLFNTPKNTKNNRRKLTDELLKAQIEKELMMAAYFRAKTEKIKLENIKLINEIDRSQNKTD